MGRRNPAEPWGVLRSPAGLVLLCVLPWACPDPSTADDATALSPQVVLKGGRTLLGKVVRTTRTEDKTFATVQTDFGEILVPQTEIVKRDPGVNDGADTFVAREIRIVRLEGDVQRRASGDQAWFALATKTEYAGQAPPEVRPGDTLRTGTDGTIELLLQHGVWVRVFPGSEVEVTSVPARGTLSLLRGRVLQDVQGRPRGATYRVRTPSTVLGVRGTRFSVTVRSEGESASVLEGVVDIGGGVLVSAGEEARWAAGPTKPSVAPLTAEEREALGVQITLPPPLDMAYVPAGRYRVGVWDFESGGKPPPGLDGRPLQSHYVSQGWADVAAFLIDRHELTRSEFRAFQRANGAVLPADAQDARDGRMPQYGVSFEDAERFALWAGKQLATATQWEVAARGTDGRFYPWGSIVNREYKSLPLGAWADYGWTPSEDLRSVDAPTLDVSPFGVSALASSVPEWVRRDVPGEPIWPLLRSSAQEFLALPGAHPVRGVRNSLFLIMAAAGGTPPGFRCVIEFNSD